MCRQQPSQTQRFTAEKSWRLGVRTNKRPANICQDLHNAFAELGISFKHCGPYNYKCRATVRAVRLMPEKSAVCLMGPWPLHCCLCGTCGPMAAAPHLPVCLHGVESGDTA